MSIFKPKKSKKGAIVAVVGTAVAAGAAYLATTKKGKSMVKDAKKGVTSMLGAAEKESKIVGKKVQRTAAKASTAVQKAKQSVRKASAVAAKEKTAAKRKMSR